MGWNSSPDKPKEPGGFKNNALRALGGVLDILDKPGNAVRSGSVAIRKSGNPLSFIPGAFNGITGKTHTSVEDFTKQGLGFELPKNPIAHAATSFGVGVAFDPTTYLTLGTKTAGEAALKEGGELLAEKAAAPVASFAEREAAKSALTTLKGDVAEQGAKGLYQHVSRDELKQRITDKLLASPGTKMDALKASKIAEKELSTFDQFAKGGINLHVPGTSLTKNVVSGQKIGQLAETSKIAPVARKIAGTEGAKRAQRLISPRARIKQDLGKETAQAVGEASVKSRSIAETLTQRDAVELNAARKAVKATPEDSALAARAISEVKPTFTAAEQTRLQEIKPLVDTAKRVRDRTTATLVHEHLLTNALPGKTYLHRTLTDAGNRVFNNPEAKNAFTKAASQAKKDLMQGGSLTERNKAFENLSAREVNNIIEPQLRSQGLLKDGEHLFDEGVVNPLVERGQQAAEAVAQKSFITDVADLKDTNGNRLIMNASQNAPSNFVTRDFGPLGVLKVHPDIAPELDRVKTIITNDADVKAFENALNVWNRWWKSAATVLPVSGAFTARNARSNVFLNYLAGVVNPKVYTEAGGIQKILFKLEHTKAGNDLVAKKGFEEAVNQSMNARQATLFREARKHEIFGSSFTREDLRAGETLKETDKKGKAKSVANQFGVNSKAIRAGAQGNLIVENNARLAHFIDKLDKTGSPEEAALSVKKYLFDYGDLTPFERSKIKKVIPFYTFMRKNTPLIVENLIKNPAKFTIPEHAKEGVLLNPDQNKTPEYLQNGHELPAGLAKAFGIGNGSIGITNADNPLAAFDEQVVKPVASAAQLLPGGKYIVPKALQAGSKAQAYRNLINIAGGPIPELAKYAGGQATGVDVFTGGKAKSGAGAFAKAITPGAGRAASAFSPKGTVQTNALKDITGIGITKFTPKQQANVKKHQDIAKGKKKKKKSSGGWSK
jgi:hypothetical protein